MPRLRIRGIQANMTGIEAVGRIVGMTGKRRVHTRFGFADVASTRLEDETGSIHINLWRDQINVVQEGHL